MIEYIVTSQHESCCDDVVGVIYKALKDYTLICDGCNL